MSIIKFLINLFSTSSKSKLRQETFSQIKSDSEIKSDAERLAKSDFEQFLINAHGMAYFMDARGMTYEERRNGIVKILLRNNKQEK